MPWEDIIKNKRFIDATPALQRESADRYFKDKIEPLPKYQGASKADQQRTRINFLATIGQEPDEIGGFFAPLRRGYSRAAAGVTSGMLELMSTWAPEDVPMFGREDLIEAADFWRKRAEKYMPETRATGGIARPIDITDLSPLSPTSPLNPKRAYKSLAENLPMLGMFIGSYLINPIFGQAVMISAEGGDAARTLNEYEKETGTKIPNWQRKLIPLSVGIINAKLETLGIETMLGRKFAGIATGKITKLLLRSGVEGGEEFLQQGVQVLGEMGYGKEQDASKVLTEMWESFYGGALMGGVVGGGSLLLEGRTALAPEEEALQGKVPGLKTASPEVVKGVAAMQNVLGQLREKPDDKVLQSTYHNLREDLVARWVQEHPEDDGTEFERMLGTSEALTEKPQQIRITDEEYEKGIFTVTLPNEQKLVVNKHTPAVARKDVDRVLTALNWVSRESPTFLSLLRRVTIIKGQKTSWLTGVSQVVVGKSLSALKNTSPETADRLVKNYTEASGIYWIDPKGEVRIALRGEHPGIREKETSRYVRGIVHETTHAVDTLAMKKEEAEFGEAFDELKAAQESEARADATSMAATERFKKEAPELEFQQRLLVPKRDKEAPLTAVQRVRLERGLGNLFSKIYISPTQLYDENWVPVNAAIDTAAGVLRLSPNVEANTIGHEGFHMAMALLGEDNDVVQAGLRLADGDVEKLADSVGAYYYDKLMAISNVERVGNWLKTLWAEFKNVRGAELSQQDVVRMLTARMRHLGTRQVGTKLRIFDTLETFRGKVNVDYLPLKNISKEEQVYVKYVAQRIGKKVVTTDELQAALLNDMVQVRVEPAKTTPEQVANKILAQMQIQGVHRKGYTLGDGSVLVVEKLPIPTYKGVYTKGVPYAISMSGEPKYIFFGFQDASRALAEILKDETMETLKLGTGYTIPGTYNKDTHVRLLFNTPIDFGQPAHGTVSSTTAMGWAQVADKIDDPYTLIAFEVQPSDIIKEQVKLIKEELAAVELPVAIEAAAPKLNAYFYRALIQDAAAKGYKKILFPVGETIAEIEGNEKVVELYNALAKRMEKEYKGRTKRVMLGEVPSTDPGQLWAVPKPAPWLEVSLIPEDATRGAMLYQRKKPAHTQLEYTIKERKDLKKADDKYTSQINLRSREWKKVYKEVKDKLLPRIPEPGTKDWKTLQDKADKFLLDSNVDKKAEELKNRLQRGDGISSESSYFLSLYMAKKVEQQIRKASFMRNPMLAFDKDMTELSAKQALETYQLVGTELGRGLASRRLLGETTQLFNMLKTAIEEGNLSKRQSELITQAALDGKLSDPMAARELVASFKESTVKDLIWSLYYNGILSGFTTWGPLGINAWTNTTWLMWLMTADRSAQALVDSVRFNPIVKGLFPTTKHQEAFFSDVYSLWKGAIVGPAGTGGIKRAYRIASDIMHGRMDIPEDLRTKWKLEIGPAQGAWMRYPNKAINKMAPFIEFPSEFLIVTDVFFRSIARDAFENMQMAQKSRETGVPINSVLQTMTEAERNTMYEASSAFGLHATFFDKPGGATKAIMNIRDAIPGGRIPFPFVNTLVNILKRGIEFTPGLGMVRLVQRETEARTIWARQLQGTLLTMALFSLLWDEDRFTGAPPTQKGKRDVWQAAGKTPHSFRVGDHWIRYDRAGEPISFAISSLLAVRDAWKAEAEKKEKGIDVGWDEVFLNSVHGVINNIMDHYVTDNILTAIGSPKAFERAVKRIPASFAPYSSFVREIKRSVEALDDGSIKSKENDTVLSFLADALPWAGLRGEVPNRINVLGDEVEISGGLMAQWLPFSWQKQLPEDSVEMELVRLDKYPGLPSTIFTIKGQTHYIPEAFYREYSIAYGKAVKASYRKTMDSPVYERLTDEGKLDYLDKRSASARERVRSLGLRAFRQQGLDKQ